jgi:hypothetical protein
MFGPERREKAMTDAPTPKVSTALSEALRGHKTKAEDRAAVVLARLYAGQIDEDPDLLVKLGPLLLSVLDSLAMTPRGRAAVLGKGGPQGGTAEKSQLDKLREKRAVRGN